MMKVVGMYRECANIPNNHLIAVAMNIMHKCQNLKVFGYLNFGLWKDYVRQFWFMTCMCVLIFLLCHM